MLWAMNVSSVLFRCCVVTHTVSALNENAWYALLCNIVHTCDNRHSKQRYISTIHIGSLTHSQFWDQQNQVARTHTWIERQTNSSFDVHGLNNLKKCQTRIMTHSTRILRYTITILCVLKVDIQTVPINRNKLMNIKLWCIMHCDMYL